MIYGERVKQAREFSGWSQTELAQRVGITQPAIAYIESGRTTPSDSVLEAIAFQTGFPVAFFRQPPAAQLSLGSLLFRSRTQVTASARTMAYRRAEMAYELAAHLLRRVKPLPLRIPSLNEEPPATAADITRAQMGLPPDSPVPNLINALERAGVVVLMLDVPIEGIDAFSTWVGPEHRPVIFLVPNKSTDRLRWSVAHELAHLVLHRTFSGNTKTVEDEAHEFAAQFLLPEDAMRQELIPPVTLTSVAGLKPRWRVSMQALIRRAKVLGIITNNQYRYLFQQLSAKGWRTCEPIDLPPERPRGLRQLAELVYGTPLNYRKIANDARLPVRFVEDIIQANSGSTLPNNSGHQLGSARVISLRSQHK